MTYQEKISYLAGIFDGEGCIYSMFEKIGYYRIRLSVSNTDKRLMDWLVDNFGGRVMTKYASAKKNPQYKLRYEWCLSITNRDIPLLESLLPFLIIKKERIEIAIQFLATVRGRIGRKRLSEQEKAVRKECFKKLKVLNVRGSQLQRLSVEDAGNSVCNSPNCKDGKLAESTEMILRPQFRKN